MNPAGSFLKFVLGFLTFISLSFIITFAVHTYTATESAEQQAAAAMQTMLK